MNAAARKCEQCGKESPAAISFYRHTTPGQWLCFKCVSKRRALGRRLLGAFRAPTKGKP
jgi:hypothetical protein